MPERSHTLAGSDHHTEHEIKRAVNDYAWYNDLGFFYDKGKNVRVVLASRWKMDGETPVDFEQLWAREFMYDSPRQRFLARELDPTPMTPPYNPPLAGAWQLTEYAGNTPYLDSDWTSRGVGDPIVQQRRTYGPGGWEDLEPSDPNDPNSAPMVAATRFAQGDLIDSTVMTTDEAGAPVATAAYSAFGELVGGSGFQPENLSTRYRYAGGWGYEADVLHGQHAPLSGPNPRLAPITLLHVGARWYDPGIGRFVQRDPIGLNGGINVYLYGGANPLAGVDPTGEGFWEGDSKWFGGVHDWVARKWWAPHGDDWVNSPWATAEAVAISALPCLYFVFAGGGATALTWEYAGGYLFQNGRLVGQVVESSGKVGELCTYVYRTAEGVRKVINLPFFPP